MPAALRALGQGSCGAPGLVAFCSESRFKGHQESQDKTRHHSKCTFTASGSGGRESSGLPRLRGPSQNLIFKAAVLQLELKWGTHKRTRETPSCRWPSCR